MIYNLFEEFGKFTLMLKQMFAKPENGPMYWKELMRQMVSIGVGSVIIVSIISIFIGAVSAVQYAYQLSESYVPNYFIGYMVRDSLILEFAPNITCIVLAGKVGSNITSELGGMRQKEQIDALEIMGVNTASYLVFPKIIAGFVVIPMLVVFAAFVGITGGYLATISAGIMTGAEFMKGLYLYYDSYSIVLMLIKAFVYSFIITGLACYKGYYVKGGSVELGKASTQTVVLSNILIIVCDLIVVVLFG